MPLFESACTNRGCLMLDVTVEHFYHNERQPLNRCDSCGGKTEKVLSTFAMAFSGDITARYKDKDKDGGYEDGHWAWTRKTPDGKPRPVRLETWQQQKEFCKSEGLTNPRELPKHAEVSADGKSISSRGMPGQEI
jgi:predicted nucleic acid-binding Zn ribbon protein